MGRSREEVFTQVAFLCIVAEMFIGTVSNNVVGQTCYKFADTYRLVHVNNFTIHSSRDSCHYKHIDIKFPP